MTTKNAWMLGYEAHNRAAAAGQPTDRAAASEAAAARFGRQPGARSDFRMGWDAAARHTAKAAAGDALAANALAHAGTPAPSTTTPVDW